MFATFVMVFVRCIGYDCISDTNGLSVIEGVVEPMVITKALDEWLSPGECWQIAGGKTKHTITTDTILPARYSAVTIESTPLKTS
jgi:hypothetical protein